MTKASSSRLWVRDLRVRSEGFKALGSTDVKALKLWV